MAGINRFVNYIETVHDQAIGRSTGWWFLKIQRMSVRRESALCTYICTMVSQSQSVFSSSEYVHASLSSFGRRREHTAQGRSSPMASTQSSSNETTLIQYDFATVLFGLDIAFERCNSFLRLAQPRMSYMKKIRAVYQVCLWLNVLGDLSSERLMPLDSL